MKRSAGRPAAFHVGAPGYLEIGTHGLLRHHCSLRFDFSAAKIMKSSTLELRFLGNGGRYPTFFSLPRREAAATAAALVLKGSPCPLCSLICSLSGCLLGGGYSALSWLAAPEPLKVTANARLVRPSPSHYPQNPVTPAAPEATMVQANSVPAGDSDHVAPGSRDQSPLPAPAAKAEVNEASEKGEANAPSVHSAMAEPAQDNQQDQKQDQKNTPPPPQRLRPRPNRN